MKPGTVKPDNFRAELRLLLSLLPHFSPQARFTDQLWTDFNAVCVQLDMVLLHLESLRMAAPAVRQQSANKAVSTMAAFFIVLLIVTNCLYFPRIIGRLNKSIKGNRALLLLLPEDVIASVKVLKETMTQLSKKLM